MIFHLHQLITYVVKMLQSIINNELYLFALLSAFIIGGIFKHKGYIYELYVWLSNKTHNHKLILFILSTISGCLPIEGRVTVGAPILDGIIKQKNSKIGILNYLSTHHYYLWSPIEPSVLIFITALGISWTSFIDQTYPLLVIYFCYLIGYFYIVTDHKDIQFEKQDGVVSYRGGWCIFVLFISLMITVILETIYKFDTPLKWIFPITAIYLSIISETTPKEVISYINFKVILAVGIIILLGTYIKTEYGTLLLDLTKDNTTLIKLLTIGFFSAFLLGSSSKYAGIGSGILVGLGNIKLLPLVVAVEFVGYMLSPTHKCMGICSLYFNTKITEMYKALIPLSLLLISIAYFIVYQ